MPSIMDEFTVGTLLPYQSEVHWEIDNFSSYLEKERILLLSPEFHSFNNAWRLVFINRIRIDSTHVDEFFVYFYTANLGPPLKVQCKLEIKGESACEEKKNALKISYYQDFPYKEKEYFPFILNRSILVRNKSALFPSDILTIRCCMKIVDSEETPGRWPMKLTELEALSKDLESLFSNNANSDITFHVQEKVFRAHRSILSARSKVLASMFEHELSESKTGIVDVLDCDPDAFEVFLRYLYSGKVEDLTQEKAQNLFKIADKYGDMELKSFCSEFMKQHLTPDSVPIVAMVARLYDEHSLLNSVQNFFNKNKAAVVATESWEELLKKDYRLANTLLNEMSSKKQILKISSEVLKE